MANIIVLSATSQPRFIEEGKKRGHTVHVIRPDDFVINFDREGGAKLFVKDENFARRRYDAVIPRLGGQTLYGTFVLRYLLEYSGIFSTATPQGILNAADKGITALELNLNKFRQPLTTTVKGPDDFKFLVQSVAGLPAILKNVKGSQGKGIYLMETPRASAITFSNLRQQNLQMVLQEFIETSTREGESKNDLRIFVVGGKVAAAMKRHANEDDIRSNVTLSGKGEAVELTSEEIKMAVDAAKCLGLGVAGVDIARNMKEGGRPYIIEVNSNPGLKIEGLTGKNVVSEIINYVEEELEKRKFRQPQLPEQGERVNVTALSFSDFKSHTKEVSEQQKVFFEMIKNYKSRHGI